VLRKSLIFEVMFIAASTLWAESTPSFSREILPILSDSCFHCHGPDESHRKADLRLDVREEAIKLIKGVAAIVPGDPDASALMDRISTKDPDELMPPQEAHKKALSPRQIDLFRTWIKAGADWGKHWAFTKPEKLKLKNLGEHPIDELVSLEWTAESPKATVMANKHTLLNRLSYGLTGLPPSQSDLNDFLAASEPNAFLKWADHYLASPQYGERMAMWWMDAARYSDTDGYQADAERENWPWRDWVVEAFNRNMPYDQFTIEQFAGDLLPQATSEQKMATCFFRNHMTNGEGGRDPEESRVDYVRDRVNTMGTVWLGLTLGCAQCHTHKFDPITHKEYYQLTAFFNSIDEDGNAGKKAKPYLTVNSTAAIQQLPKARHLEQYWNQKIKKLRASVEGSITPWLEACIEQADSFQAWHPLEVVSLSSKEGSVLKETDAHAIEASGVNPKQDDYRIEAKTKLSKVTGFKLDVLPVNDKGKVKLSRGENGLFILTNIKLQVIKQGHSQTRVVEIKNAVANFEDTKADGKSYGKVKDTLDDDPRKGWTTTTDQMINEHSAVFEFEEPLQLAENETLQFLLFHRSTMGDANIAKFVIKVTDQQGPSIRSLAKMPMEQLKISGIQQVQNLPAELKKALLEQYLEDHEEYQFNLSQHQIAKEQLSEAEKAAKDLNVMVCAERETPRKTYVLERGVWDKHEREVQPGVLNSILDWSAKNMLTRLDLANWLVSKDNPLGARVIVNHIWQMLFGQGLVRTPGDFGLQGEQPTHPMLLDWLAVELMEHKWDLKYLIRLIVTSQTFQRSSDATKEEIEKDPENRLLCRGSRFRLPSWMLRDSALKNSGLLNLTLGGKPIRPYQPEGIWEEIFMGRITYTPSIGEDQYRRSLYAFWRRSSSPAFLFDVAQRQLCEVDVKQTNTPLQALLLMNDTTYLEASKSLALRVMQDYSEVYLQIKAVARAILSRDVNAEEIKILCREYERSYKYYSDHKEESEQWLAVGQSGLPLDNHSAELAALMLCASLIFNMDETLTLE